MKKNLLLICACVTMLGCASHKYGYSMDKWSSLTQQERDKIKNEADENTKKMMEEQREREFLNKPINSIFGTRSNAY